MAEQKFLGQEGTDVLVEKIKSIKAQSILTDVELFLANLYKAKDALEPYKTIMDGIPDTLPTDVRIFCLSIYLLALYPTELTCGAFNVLPPLQPTNDPNVKLGLYNYITSLIDYFELTNDVLGMKASDFFKMLPHLFPVLFSRVSEGSTQSIEEITAQEVSDKFNS